MSSRNNTHWLRLVKAIYKGRKNCPHRQDLIKVVRAASSLYCVKSKREFSDKEIEEIEEIENNESDWLRLVKSILHDTKCKYNGKLKIVLKKASKVYCKAKKTLKNKPLKNKTISNTTPVLNNTPVKKTRKSFLAMIGLA